MPATPRNNCTLLVSSCDAHSDVWQPFFMCLEKYWPTMNWPIMLNTETKSYKYGSYDIQTLHLYQNKKDQWSKRLKETLQHITTEYVFFILDDFFIVEPVDTKFVDQCFKWMDEDPNIAVFSFHPVRDKNNTVSKKYKGFEKRPRHGEYKLNCQAAIWRRENLIKFLRGPESPWDFEVYGSIRVGGYDHDFYTLLPNHPHPIEYNMRKGGTGLVRGMWSKEVVIPLFKELGLKVDFSKRGFAPEDYFDKPAKVSNKDRIQNGIKHRSKTAHAKLQAKLASLSPKNNL